MISDFSKLLKALISSGFSSQREFAKKVSPSSAVTATASYVNQVTAGKKPPPLDRLNSWADALELYGEERQRFMDLAAIAHLPVEVQPRFLTLLRQLQTLKALALENEQRLNLLEGQRDGSSKSK